MAFIGNTNTTQAFTPAIDYFNGNGSTTAFTLSRPVASVAQVQAVVNNVPQLPGTAYTVSGNTITFTSAPSSGTSNIYVYYTSPITQVIAPGQGTVAPTQIDASYSLWNKSGSDINYTAGNVGVGISSPASRLHVQGGNGTGGITNPSGTFAAIVSHNQDGSGLNGLSVSNRWAASTSTVFELAAGWNGSANGYYPFFRYDGIGQRFSSIYGTAGSSSGTTLYPEFQCRAWVNFNGTGTVAIRASGNVTSITDNGVGLYTVNLTNAMPDTNYTVCGGVSAVTPASNSNAPCFAVAANSTSAFSVSTFQSQSVGTQTDLAYDQFAVFR